MKHVQKEQNTLLKTQRRFKEVLNSERAVMKGDGSWLRDIPPVDLSTRVGVYRYAYWARIIESLEEDFPKTLKKLGKKAFAKSAKTYIKENPSRFASLAEVSRDFPGFISKANKAFGECARLEWLENLAFLTEDPASNLAEMANLAEDTIQSIRFLLNPSLQIYESGKMRKILFRLNRKVVARPITVKQLKVLKEIGQKKTLSELHRFCKREKITEKEASLWFSNWTRDKIIYGFEKCEN